jgi:hypothetical protein
MLRWTGHHLPIFKLPEELAAALALTDMSQIRWDSIPWPFPTFAVQLPASLNWSFLLDSKIRIPADFVIVHCYKALRPGDAARVLGRANADTFAQADVPALLRAEVLRIKISGMCSNALQSGEISSYIDPGVHPTVGEHATIYTDADRKPLYVGDELFTAKDSMLQSAIFRIAIGTCLHITEYGRGKKLGTYTTKSKKRKTAKGALNFPKADVWVLAAPVQLAKTAAGLVEAAREITESGSSPRWQLKSRFIVRGHYRNQACGPGRTQHRWKWISPFWKGPTAGEQLLRTYDVDKQTQKPTTERGA